MEVLTYSFSQGCFHKYTWVEHLAACSRSIRRGVPYDFQTIFANEDELICRAAGEVFHRARVAGSASPETWDLKAAVDEVIEEASDRETELLDRLAVVKTWLKNYGYFDPRLDGRERCFAEFQEAQLIR